MTTQAKPTKRLGDLCAALLKLKTTGEAQAFLEDLLTPAEISAITERWTIALLLNKGLSDRAINEATGVSTATVTRVARCLAQGSGGYKKILARVWA